MGLKGHGEIRAEPKQNESDGGGSGWCGSSGNGGGFEEEPDVFKLKELGQRSAGTLRWALGLLI